MATGTFQILNVAPAGGNPARYALTISSQPNIQAGDHIGARLSTGAGAIYLVITAGSDTSILVEDSLTESRGFDFGAPARGDGGFGTPEPNRDLTQLPFNAPGWDAATRRNDFLTDAFSDCSICCRQGY